MYRGIIIWVDFISHHCERILRQGQQETGEYLTANSPYGYMRDPDNPKKHWIVDDEAAAVVRQIFIWCMEGYGPSQIAHRLKDAKVGCPTVHWMKMGRNAPAKTFYGPYGWVPDTVSGILEKQEYLGHTVNFKTRRQSYKTKKEELRAKVEMLENEIQNQEDQAENVDRFIRVAKKHLYLEKMTPDVLNDMVQAVYVHAPDTSSGQGIQGVDISYNYIGILPANLFYDIINGKAA